MALDAVPGTDHQPHSRRLPVVGWVGLVLVYLALITVLGQVLTRGLASTYAAPADVNELWRSITVPVAVSAVFVAAVITYLGWWRPVMVDDRPVQRWVVVVPVVMVVSILAVTSYSGLAGKGVTFTLLLAVSMLLVGFAEELMFRGLGVTTFRSNGFSEGKVALWSTLAFGLAHSANLFSTGVGGLGQVVATVVAGYFFYLIRRSTGGLFVPALIHAGWDLSLISNSVDRSTTHPQALVALLTVVVLAVVLLVRRRRIEPTASEVS